MKNQMKTVVLLGGLSALVIGLGSYLAPGNAAAFAAIALLMNLGAYFFSDKLVLRMHGAREVGSSQAPGLHRIVEDLSAKAGLPKLRIYLIEEAQPNAFATGRNPAHGVVAVTAGLLQILDERQLRGVLAHELSHIKNRDILVASVAAGLSSIVTWLANALSFAAIFGGASRDEEHEGAGGGLLAALVAPVAATLVQLGISRSREYLADESAARLTGDPEALASALLQLERAAQVLPAPVGQPATASLFIVNPLAGAGSVLRLFSTHPSTEERVARLMALSRELQTGRPLTRRGPWQFTPEY